jgi:hypothetical protein
LRQVEVHAWQRVKSADAGIIGHPVRDGDGAPAAVVLEGDVQRAIGCGRVNARAARSGRPYWLGDALMGAE